MTLTSRLREAVDQGQMSGRLWLYSNYHCNLACRYCLTESSPKVPRRIMGRDRMVNLAHQALALGFEGIGITGGEPMMLPWMVDMLDEVSRLLPVTMLTNGTLFTPRRLDEMATLAGRDLRLQISLDRPDPQANDAMRGPENFDKVIRAVPALLERGLRVRIASTLEDQSDDEATRLQRLVSSLGVAPEDHIMRAVVDRGRADLEGMGKTAPLDQMPPELTLTADGAFWSPFAPTYRDGRLQIDLLLSRTIAPLTVPTKVALDLVATTPLLDDGEATAGFV